MKYWITCSTGKDSEAAVWWAKNNLPFDSWELVFNDVDWDNEAVYSHLKYLEERVGKKFHIVKSVGWREEIGEENYNAIVEIFGERNIFAELVIHKGRFSSTKARICTQKLKIEPFIDFILDVINGDAIIVQGVRAEESPSRRIMKVEDDYFKFYFEPYKHDSKGNPLYHTYRKQEIFELCNKHEITVYRPVLYKTANEVFNDIFENGSPGNPLYRKGQSRVGCYPCVQCKLGEIKLIAKDEPKRIDQIDALEKLSGSTFFPPGYIPIRFCTKMALCKIYREDLVKVMILKSKSKNKDQGIMFDVAVTDPEEMLYQLYFKNPLIEVYIDEEGYEYIWRRVKVPTIRDVVKYVLDNPDQVEAFPMGGGCVSVYNICETPNQQSLN